MSIRVQFIKTSKDFSKNFIYLVFDTNTRDGIIIDPAWDLEQIESLLSDHDVHLSMILLTHYHSDHVNLANTLAIKYHVQVFMNKIEIDFYSFHCRSLCAIDGSKSISFGQGQISPIHTPGHTKGSTCYLIANNLFTGDTLFIEGCGLCSGKGANPCKMFNSLQQLKSQIDAETVIYPGHSFGESPGKKFIYLLQNNIYLLFENREQFISFRMRENQQRLFAFQ